MTQHRTTRLTLWKRPRATITPRRTLAASAGLSHLRPEGRLLVLCARARINEYVRVETADLASEPLNWGLVWELAKAHGVTPLVYQNLATICPKVIPSETHKTFRRHIQANGLLNTLLAKELVSVLDALTAKGVRAIPFKGVTLAQIAYGNLSLRECADLDLIVERSSIPQARQVLWSLGYQLTTTSETESESDEPFNFFQKKNGILAVDLQWVMARQHFAFRLDRPAFWTRLKPVLLPSKPILSLCPEDLLILLCVHGSKHGWEQLKWICDVAELVQRRKTLDWSRVLFQAEEWGCRRMVLLGLALARNLFDVKLPSAVIRSIEDDEDIPGFEEARAEGLYFTLKDSWLERWKFGLSLCRVDSPAIDETLPWFRRQPALRTLHRCVRPVHRLIVRFLPSARVRQAMVRWLQSPG